MVRRELMAEVNGGQVGGRPRLGWMDGVKVSLGKILFVWQQRNDCGACATMREKSERVESPSTYVTSFTRPFCLVLCLSDRPPVNRWLSH